MFQTQLFIYSDGVGYKIKTGHYFKLQVNQNEFSSHYDVITVFVQLFCQTILYLCIYCFIVVYTVLLASELLFWQVYDEMYLHFFIINNKSDKVTKMILFVIFFYTEVLIILSFLHKKCVNFS
jgi:hypothetical protein